MRKFIFGVITIAIFTGCGEKAKTKEYYEQHLDEAKARIEQCKKLEKYDEIQQLDCENAKLAVFYAPNQRVDNKSNPDALKW